MVQIPKLNLIKKNCARVDLKIALCYPNVYRAGMTGLTVRLLYALFNMREGVLCERFFIPTLGEPLRSLESDSLSGSSMSSLLLFNTKRLPIWDMVRKRFI